MIFLTFRSTTALVILFGSLYLSTIQVARSDSDSDDSKASNTSVADKIIHKIVPSCVFGVDTVSFLAFSSKHPEGVSIDNPNVDLNFKGHLTCLIPGFIAEANSTEMVGIARKLIDTWNHTVLSLNWEEESCAASLNILDPIAYPAAAINTKGVGVKLTEHILNLTSTYGIPIDKVTLIGHSLGAHVAGFAGKELQSRTGKSYPAIYGLDPAGPSFNTASCEKRLCQSDANFVEIYHTSKVFGYQWNLGDIDLWFSGGYAQPGCLLPTCSHSRAEEYFRNSLDKNCEYIGIKESNSLSMLSNVFNFKKSVSDCTAESCVLAGPFQKNKNIRGSFYVPLTSSEPYCTVTCDKTDKKGRSECKRL